ncbi:protein FAR-RED ELONGATED HYPOCOTYL 1-like [Cynara cardunculus var. scolymus]|uniref:Uncharacterized protein n=1 Tax=Cynara cardunculus var. scolymus TaxID=59895 RepID=A0A118JVZ0_CYNCS|nr:protein FAR-RED ELONGATED HYPOCOTYL 1-like [Cynara cardunculus var. scolymus]KVH94837.1 hypothetical protein Ccrd_003093 [Cynara cardunculus var. scolymus]
MNSKLEMDEDPCGINRKLYMNKRKFHHGSLDLPVSKHACFEKSSNAETCFPSNIQSDIEDLRNSRKERSTYNSHSIDDQIEQGSEKDSNSFSEDADSVMSVSIDSKNELHYLKICPPDQNSDASVNWGSRFFDSSVNYLDRSETKACDENFMNPAYNVYESPSFEEQQMDCGNIDEFDSSEYKNGGTKPLDDLFCSDGVIPDNFVLSSGRWNVNQDTEQGTEKMTIDKEFEQYFSMLML